MNDYPNNETLMAVINAIDETKVDKIDGKGLSTNDFTNGYKEKLDGLDLENITFEESDPTVPAWAKAPSKPTYTASEVGAYSNTEIDDMVFITVDDIDAICVKIEEVPVERVAGLYKSDTNFGELIYTWDELIENGMISVNEYDYVALILHDNSELTGDLLVADGIECIPIDGGSGCFYENLTSLVLPSGFKYLGHCALGQSSTLSKVYLPTSVTTIAATAFSGSSNLTVYYAGSESQWNAIETEHMDCCMDEPDSCPHNRIPDGGIVYNYTFE
jgi:hypothetical protein